VETTFAPVSFASAAFIDLAAAYDADASSFP
jgi:hypothetical protein